MTSGGGQAAARPGARSLRRPLRTGQLLRLLRQPRRRRRRNRQRCAARRPGSGGGGGGLSGAPLGGSCEERPVRAGGGGGSGGEHDGVADQQPGPQARKAWEASGVQGGAGQADAPARARWVGFAPSPALGGAILLRARGRISRMDLLQNRRDREPRGFHERFLPAQDMVQQTIFTCHCRGCLLFDIFDIVINIIVVIIIIIIIAILLLVLFYH